MMLPTIVSVFVFLLYCLSAILIYQQLGKTSQTRWVTVAPGWLAVITQALLLYHLIFQPGALNLGFFPAFALASWLICIQILASAYYKRIESLGIAVFPISGLASLAAVTIDSTHLIETGNSAIQGHILISIIAYSLITLGAFQVLLMAYQDHAIRSHHPGGLIRYLPPIHDMETLLFMFLGFGFVCLSASLVSGFFYLEDIFAQHLVHKTTLSIIAWFILGILLFGRFRFGWRGKTAVRWTLSAFIFLMLAFFGSKLVLEFLLQ